jgi:hypothetical protein
LGPRRRARGAFRLSAPPALSPGRTPYDDRTLLVDGMIGIVFGEIEPPSLDVHAHSVHAKVGYDFSEAFEYGLDLILDGLEHRRGE